MYKKIVVVILFSIYFQACSVATKTKEFGSGMSNVNHPVVFGMGVVVYNIGRSLEDESKNEILEGNNKEYPKK